MARTIVTPEMIKEMNELYLQLKTYAAVSRAMGGSPSATTVKKYIIPNYVAEVDRKIIRFDAANVPDENVNFEPFVQMTFFDELCALSESEVEEVKQLWEEISI